MWRHSCQWTWHLRRALASAVLRLAAERPGPRGARCSTRCQLTVGMPKPNPSPMYTGVRDAGGGVAGVLAPPIGALEAVDAERVVILDGRAHGRDELEEEEEVLLRPALPASRLEL